MRKAGQMVAHDGIHRRIVARRNLPNLAQDLFVDAQRNVFHFHSLCVTVYSVNCSAGQILLPQAEDDFGASVDKDGRQLCVHFAKTTTGTLTFLLIRAIPQRVLYR